MIYTKRDSIYMKNNIIYNSILNFTYTSEDSSNINWDIGIEDNIYTFTSKKNKINLYKILACSSYWNYTEFRTAKRRFMIDYISNYLGYTKCLKKCTQLSMSTNSLIPKNQKSYNYKLAYSLYKKCTH